MSKTVDIVLSGGSTLAASVYETATPGLVVHREYRYSPSKRAHRTTSKWTVTHEATGLALLMPAQMFETKMEAMALAEKLKEVADWVDTSLSALDTDVVWNSVTELATAVSNQHFAGDVNRDGMTLDEITTDEDYDGLYGMRTEGRGRDRTYVIFNKDTDEVVETHHIPGRATSRLVDLNTAEEDE